MTRNFKNLLQARWESAGSLLCVGLDPDPNLNERLKDPRQVFGFCREAIDSTHDLVCAFKPQIAYFSALRAEAALEDVISYIHENYPAIPVILDAKRGDIGSTARMYAIEAFDRYRADAVTLSPYMGKDSVAPFLERAEKGCIFLCKTSNLDAGQFQNLESSGRTLSEAVAETVVTDWNMNGNCGLVVGATYPTELKRVREIVGDIPLLMPGGGAQGGNVSAAVRAGMTSNLTGLIVSSSRAILYPKCKQGEEDTIRAAAKDARAEIENGRQSVN